MIDSPTGTVWYTVTCSLTRPQLTAAWVVISNRLLLQWRAG